MKTILIQHRYYVPVTDLIRVIPICSIKQDVIEQCENILSSFIPYNKSDSDARRGEQMETIPTYPFKHDLMKQLIKSYGRDHKKI